MFREGVTLQWGRDQLIAEILFATVKMLVRQGRGRRGMGPVHSMVESWAFASSVGAKYSRKKSETKTGARISLANPRLARLAASGAERFLVCKHLSIANIAS